MTLLVIGCIRGLPATTLYVSPSGSNIPPYADWTSAATNIQDAINVASAGDTVLVTNGVYSSGGKAIGGNLTNRVAVDKPLIVGSVNGPNVTFILGAWDPITTNGPLAVRCAWLTNGATLSGFTCLNGATRALSDPVSVQRTGGGIWGSSNALSVVTNCIIATNSASSSGGGALQVLLLNCTLVGNVCPGNGPRTASGGAGGGAFNCNLRNCILAANYAANQGGGAAVCNSTNCALVANSSGWQGGGLAFGKAINCTIVNNLAGTPFTPGGLGGGAYAVSLTNCVVVRNVASPASDNSSNYYSGNLSYCCAFPLPAGIGNISVDPNLLPDGIHLAQNSPGRAAGLASMASGFDIDQQPWANPPSIGCDEWVPIPAIATHPRGRVAGIPPRVELGSEVVAGQEPFSYTWMKDYAALADGQHYNLTQSSNMTVNGFGPPDAGFYQVVVSNAFGLATGAVQVVVHCVDAASTGEMPPYTNWATAASNIQDAADLSANGEFVLVTNGLYNTGGRAQTGGMSNRVAVTRAVNVTSMSGADATVIHGQSDPATTNGPLAVRCAWLADGATLSGFTLTGGATRGTGDTATLRSGGGIWAASTNALILDCVISNNTAVEQGGGCYQGQYFRCRLLANAAGSAGGGALSATLRNCLLRGNYSGQYGGGAVGSILLNCTVTENVSFLGGGGTENSSGFNCIVSSNISLFRAEHNWFNLSPFNGFSNSCTTPLPGGIGNIAADPQLLDGIHLAVTSPCRGTGSPAYAVALDIDGEPWTNPPSMGCDEVWEPNLTGPLSVTAKAAWPTVAAWGSLPLVGTITGKATRAGWEFGDGSVLTNGSYVNATHIWTNGGDYVVTFTAYNTDLPSGVSTNVTVHVVPLLAPQLSVGGLSGTNFTLSFPGQPGVMYVVEQATNLAAPVLWRTVSSVSSTGSVMQVTDTKATNAARYYRVRSQ